MASAHELIKLANQRLGDRYALGVLVPKDNPRWTGPWDCAEFVSWVIFQSTGMLLGCTNNSANPALADAYSGAWARDAELSPRRIGIGQAKSAPAAVLIRKPGSNGIGHVAISQGDGSTIEAHSTKHGVSRHQVDGRRWDLAMLPPLIDHRDDLRDSIYSPPNTFVLRLVFPPMHGRLIKDVQRALLSRGFNPGKIDGVYGPHTEAAVRAFQLFTGLVNDGEVGAATLQELGLA